MIKNPFKQRSPGMCQAGDRCCEEVVFGEHRSREQSDQKQKRYNHLNYSVLVVFGDLEVELQGVEPFTMNSN